MGARELLLGERRTQETLSTEVEEMLPVRLFFLWLPEPAGAGEGSWEQLGVSCLWEFKAQRLGPDRPEGAGRRLPVCLWTDGPAACPLSLVWMLLHYPWKSLLALWVTPLSSLLVFRVFSPHPIIWRVFIKVPDTQEVCK